jgi:hypothetical protein
MCMYMLACVCTVVNRCQNFASTNEQTKVLPRKHNSSWDREHVNLTIVLKFHSSHFSTKFFFVDEYDIYKNKGFALYCIPV